MLRGDGPNPALVYAVANMTHVAAIVFDDEFNVLCCNATAERLLAGQSAGWLIFGDVSPEVTIDHPVRGRLTLTRGALMVPDRPDLLLVILTPADEASAQRLHALGS